MILAVKNNAPDFPGALVFKLRSGVGGAQAMTKSNASQSTLPAHDQQAGPTGIARTASTWSATARWAWACALPVSGIARSVANCIARHANDKTGLAWPGFARIAEETGFKRRAVIAATQELEKGAHLTVSRVRVGGKNKSNRYQLPPMGSAPRALGSAPHAPGSAPHALGGSAPHAPESVRVESVKKKGSSDARTREASVENSAEGEREVCPVCENDWPAKYGDTCYECTPSQRRHAAQMKRNRESEGKAPEEEPNTEETPEEKAELGKATKEDEDLKPPESAQEAVGGADGNDFAWRDRLDEIETPTFEVRNHHGERAYTFPDGSRVVTSGSSWGFGVHSTRLEDFETRGRYEGHELATAWVGAYGLTVEGETPMRTYSWGGRVSRKGTAFRLSQNCVRDNEGQVKHLINFAPSSKCANFTDVDANLAHPLSQPQPQRSGSELRRPTAY